MQTLLTESSLEYKSLYFDVLLLTSYSFTTSLKSFFNTIDSYCSRKLYVVIDLEFILYDMDFIESFHNHVIKLYISCFPDCR